ncbi:MAG: S8 family serine peptidase [Holophagales bacterium]|nr:S8 family serine peptidase [Holophagales bacterium]
MRSEGTRCFGFRAGEVAAVGLLQRVPAVLVPAVLVPAVLVPAVVLVLAVLALAAGGCASRSASVAPAQSAAGTVVSEGASGRGAADSGPVEASFGGEVATRLLVVLPPAPPSYLDRITATLADTYGLSVVMAWRMESLDQRCVVYESRRRRPVEKVALAMAGDPRVDLVEPLHVYRTRQGEPYRHLQHAADSLSLGPAHTLATGRRVRVAVVDTGADFHHPELAGRVREARTFVRGGGGVPEGGFTTDRHGTAVAGLIAAAADNGFGILGVAPEADLMILKACWPEPADPAKGLCDSYSLAMALDFAIANGSQVINLSLGGPSDSILGRLVEVALERGIAVVAAGARDAAGELLFPAAARGVLAVAAHPRPRSDPAGAGGGAPGRALAAPGQEILAPTPGGGFDFFSGASMAAAQASGVIALLLEHRSDLRPAEIAALLERSARESAGVLLIDACAVLGLALDRMAACPDPEMPSASPSSAPLLEGPPASAPSPAASPVPPAGSSAAPSSVSSAAPWIGGRRRSVRPQRPPRSELPLASQGWAR